MKSLLAELKYQACPNCNKQGVRGIGTIANQCLVECKYCEWSEWQ